ncbi:MAG TPA: MGMT family protein [Saprospiraceae bacterium]|nr:MGMT family protein [Saprospiraceae bacterium]HMP14639.1 MGMT family protein [Saprospiraceae bacterium]
MPMAKDNYHTLVWEVTRRIPRGRISTYGAIADYLALGSARMVGWALHQSLAGQDVPAHRVVNRRGELSGRNYFPTPTLMQELLEQEGVQVVDNQVCDFKQLFWHPADTDRQHRPTEKQQ